MYLEKAFYTEIVESRLSGLLVVFVVMLQEPKENENTYWGIGKFPTERMVPG